MRRQTADMDVGDFVREVRRALGLSPEPPPMPPSMPSGDRGRRLRDLGALSGR